MAKRAPGNPQGGLTFGNVPQLPGANFGGPAGDIASALGSFTGRLQELKGDEDKRAFRDAQAELEQQRFEDEQTLTRELGQARIAEQQSTRAATGRREDVRLTATSDAANLLAAQQATQNELDRAAQLNIRVGAPQQEDERTQRRNAITQMAITSLAQDRSPETAALLIKDSFRLSDEEALIAVQEAQSVLDIRAQEIAVKEAGGGSNILDLAGGAGTPLPPSLPTEEEEPSPDDVIDALIEQENLSGTDIVSRFEREGADDEEMEIVKTILRSRGIPFIESQLDIGPSGFAADVTTTGTQLGAFSNAPPLPEPRGRPTTQDPAVEAFLARMRQRG